MPTNVMIMIISIVAMGILAGIIGDWFKTRRKEAESANRDLSGDDKKRIDELEQRVKTLERIATDPSERLKREISDL